MTVAPRKERGRAGSVVPAVLEGRVSACGRRGFVEPTVRRIAVEGHSRPHTSHQHNQRGLPSFLRRPGDSGREGCLWQKVRAPRALPETQARLPQPRFRAGCPQTLAQPAARFFHRRLCWPDLPASSVEPSRTIGCLFGLCRDFVLIFL